MHDVVIRHRIVKGAFDGFFDALKVVGMNLFVLGSKLERETGLKQRATLTQVTSMPFQRSGFLKKWAS
jgi:hypothetical protein